LEDKIEDSRCSVIYECGYQNNNLYLKYLNDKRTTMIKVTIAIMPITKGGDEMRVKG